MLLNLCFGQANPRHIPIGEFSSERKLEAAKIRLEKLLNSFKTDIKTIEYLDTETNIYI